MVGTIRAKLSLSEGGIGPNWAKLAPSKGGFGPNLSMLTLSKGGSGPVRWICGQSWPKPCVLPVGLGVQVLTTSPEVPGSPGPV